MYKEGSESNCLFLNLNCQLEAPSSKMEETITPLGACIPLQSSITMSSLRSAAEHFQGLRSGLSLAELKNVFGDCFTPVPAVMECVKRGLLMCPFLQEKDV